MSKIKKSTKETQNSKESHAPCSQVDALVRQIIYTVDLQIFLKCLKGEIYTQNLPADAKIIAGYFSVEKQCFQLILESDTFPEIIPCHSLETRKFYFEKITD